jgi:glycosyltransferase involved in cell wall biosynthesis
MSNSESPYAGVAACTVVSKNYLAYARALAASLKQHHPEIPFFVLLVDRVDGHFDPAAEPFTVWTAEDLDNIPDLQGFLFKYTILELNTAVKPYYFERLFQKHDLKKLIYFDPDILIFSSLDPLLALLDTNSAVLTPHLMRPYDDGCRPTEADILQAGTHNLGFIAMSDKPAMRECLTWWQERLFDHCVVDLAHGYFVDQKWMDLAPHLFDGFYNLRDPRYNVAYWNLHERGRGLELRGDTVFLNEEPVVFFHFSGFNADKLEPISKHQNRYRLSDLPNLRPIYEYYRDQQRAHGHDAAKVWPYAYAAFDNGVKISDTVRRLYREMPENAKRFPNPFQTGGEQSYYGYLAERIVDAAGRTREGAGIPRLWWEIYEQYPELQRGFPDISGRAQDDFIRWIRTDGQEFFGIKDERLLPEPPAEGGNVEAGTAGVATPMSVPARVPRSLRKALGRPLKRLLGGRNKELLERLYYWSLGEKLAKAMEPKSLLLARDGGSPLGRGAETPSGRLPFGVNVTGYMTGEFGVAEASRSLVHAIQAAGVPTALSNIRAENLPNGDTTFTEFSDDYPYGVNLLAVNADMVVPTLAARGTDVLRNRYNIGLWYWELSEFPEKFQPAFEPLQEIWVTSAFCAEAIAKISPIPVVKVTYPVRLDSSRIMPDRARFGIPEEAFAFVFSFDYHSFMERKNPLAVVEAFRRAFGEGTDHKDAMLVLKSLNGASYPEKQKALREAAKGLNILFFEECLTRVETFQLFASCDALVSLHRSEGLGLGMAEAMALGKPVIATAYSGNMDFMDINNSLPVRYRLIELTEDYGPYPKGSVWADPDVDHAAEQMRRLYDDRAFARSIGEAAQQHIQTKHSVEAVGREVRARLNRVHERV